MLKKSLIIITLLICVGLLGTTQAKAWRLDIGLPGFNFNSPQPVYTAPTYYPPQPVYTPPPPVYYPPIPVYGYYDNHGYYHYYHHHRHYD